MNKLVVSPDSLSTKEVLLTKDRTTLGRRSHNDIVIDSPAVSDEHAVLHTIGADVFIEDLNSAHGTYVNGKSIKKQLLSRNDIIEIGQCKIKCLLQDSSYEYALMHAPRAARSAQAPDLGLCSPPLHVARPAVLIKVLTGTAAGREVALTKVVTTVGRPGVQVALIRKGPHGYSFAHVEGNQRPLINGSALEGESVELQNGDLIELAGTQFQFVCR